MRHALVSQLSVVLLVSVAACSSPDAGSTPSSGVSDDGSVGSGSVPSSLSASARAEVDPRLLEPLSMLPACPDPPAGLPDREAVPGLVLPDGAVVTRQDRTGPLTNLQGFVPMTPIEIRVFYQFEQRRLDPILMEDEIQESESLLGDGTHRLFVKAQAACDRGSAFVAVVAPEVEADAVPEPAGTLTPRGDASPSPS